MILGECTSTQTSESRAWTCWKGQQQPCTEEIWVNGKKDHFSFQCFRWAATVPQKKLCLGTWGLEIPMDSLISAADLYLAFIFLLLYCCYILELPFSTWGGGGRLGAPSVKRRRAVQSEWIDCCPLGNASRSLSRGEQFSCSFHQLWWSCQKRVWLSFAQAAPGSWLGTELLCSAPVPVLKAVAGKWCVDDSTVPELSLAHRVETLPGTPWNIWHSWHHAGILCGCYLTLQMRHYAWSYPANSHPACGRGNHSLPEGLSEHHLCHCVPQTKGLDLQQLLWAGPSPGPACQGHMQAADTSLKVATKAFYFINLIM